MNTILYTIFFSCITVVANAQNKCTVLAVYPVYRVWLPGNIPVDQNGKQTKPKLNVERSIFITTNCDTAPTFTSILYDKTAVKFSLQKPNEQEINSQIDFEGNKIKFSQPKGSVIWKIDIVALAGKSIPEKPISIKLLQKEKKKIFIVKAKKEIQLITIPTY